MFICLYILILYLCLVRTILINRKTTQHLIPIKKENDAQDSYRIYPSFNISKKNDYIF